MPNDAHTELMQKGLTVHERAQAAVLRFGYGLANHWEIFQAQRDATVDGIIRRSKLYFELIEVTPWAQA